ncbi:nicotinamide riboside transporter PnuC [Paraglaciecola hydrolytica]|uniref:Nicotinamide riboside transporter PnuC n=1 Tax=Paraglaciecola hydrolytica TaxID=1799789 RepID=A0A135ZZB0_9ALTE|nr:nicotinamide riboside transporter PnuC [Paraglaciecola hydrolytica]KXI28318.1 aminotransferase [Paraglaciecola hydrolytica]
MNLTEWLQGFAGASPLEWIATVAGFMCVYLLIKRSIWSFAFGLVQVSIYAWIFFEVKLYSDMVLQFFYIGFQFYGWAIWRRSQDDSGHVLVVKGSLNEYLLWLMAVILSTALVGYLMSNNTDASLPYPDAFTTCASLAAQWLLSHKKLFNWGFWIVVDIVAIAIYWQKQLYPTSALYLCFLVMAVIGQWQWYRAFKTNQNKTDS